MISFIAKHFVKDYKNTKDPAVKVRYGIVGSIFGLISNLILFLGKIIIGFLFGSMSIISDAINNLSDFGNSFVALFGFKLSQKPADKDHPFGHARIEYICSLLIAFIIITLGVITAVESCHVIYDSINNKTTEIVKKTQIIITITVLLLAMVIKTFQSILYYGFSKRVNSLALKCVGDDARNDVIMTAGVLVGSLITYATGFKLDGYIALIVSLLIIFSGAKLIKETGTILLGEKPDKGLVKQLLTLVSSCPGVLGCHDLEMHCYGSSIIHASLHVEVDSSKDIMESHDMIDNIEKLVLEELQIKLVIHMDPILVNDPTTDKYHVLVIEALKEIDPSLSVHDFRIVLGPTHTNCIFDVLLSEKYRGRRKEVEKQLNDIVHLKEPNCYLVISFDESYTDLAN